jgi:DNA-binding transcriptional LysR family regulator
MISLNDELWAEMGAAPVKGAVRLGAPPDLMGSFLVPRLKSYADLFPQVEISLLSASSPDLADALARGMIDIAVIEEPLGPTQGECLLIERLVWIGARAGGAHLKRPLPVSMVAETRAFRPAVLSALHEHGRIWRTVFENGNMEATTATVRADLAVTVCLASMVPSDLHILPAEAGLPELPSFAINLHLPRLGAGAAAELARHLRHATARPPHPA